LPEDSLWYKEVVFQPPNDPGAKDVQVDTQVTPATGVVAESVHDDMFNVWRCGSCTYQNLSKGKRACTMCNDPNPIQTGLSLDPWEIGELEAARASVPVCQVVVPAIPSIVAASPPNDQTPSNECQSRQFFWCKSNESADFTICIDCNGEVHKVCANLFFFQKPSKHSFIPQKDLSPYAKSQLRKMSVTERESVYICFLCQDRIVRQRISLKELKAVKRASSTVSNVTKTSKKKAKENCPSSTVLRNLRKLAAFHCYVFMFKAYEKKKISENGRLWMSLSMVIRVRK
jgi:hypothetical protein